MTIVSYSTVPDNNQALAPENTMPVNALNNAIRQDAANVRGMANELPWYNYGSGNGALAPERVSGTSFRVSADLRAVYAVGRRVRATGSSTGDIQGTITASTFASPFNTVAVAWDSGSLVAEAITIYVSTVTGAAVGALGGLPLALTADADTRLVAATDSLGEGIDFFSDGNRIVTMRPERVNIFGSNDDEFVNPRLQLLRRKPTVHAPFDSLGSVDFFGRDSTVSSDVLYARMWARPVTVTAGATDGLLDWAVSVAGTLTRLLRLRPSVLLMGKAFAGEAVPGVEIHADGTVIAEDVQSDAATLTAATVTTLTSTTGNVTTVNATTVNATTVAATTVAATGGVTVNGIAVSVILESDPQPISGTQVTFAHPLAARPKMVDFKLRCTTEQHGYAIGDDVRSAFQTAADSNNGWAVWADTTTIGLSFQSLAVTPKAGGTALAITPANWAIVFLVSG